MTYPPEQLPPSPDAVPVLDALGYVPRPDMAQFGDDDQEVAREEPPVSWKVLAGFAVIVWSLLALKWWVW